MLPTRAPAQQPTPAATPRPRLARPPRGPSGRAPQRVAGPPAVQLGGQPELPGPVARLIRSPGPGQPLPETVRLALERTLGADLSAVRVHSEEPARVAADSLGTRAFAYGTHIFLGTGESAADLGLMAHEAAHVIQQRGAPVVQQYGGGGDRFEGEAASVAVAVQSGAPTAVRERTGGPAVQPEGGLLDQGVDWLRGKVWEKLEQHAPELVPILRQGVLEWLKERLGGALQGLMDSLAGPVRSVREVAALVRRHFTALVGWLREAAAKIARNDCGPIAEAAGKIQEVFEGLAAPVVDRVKDYADKLKGFFQGLWDRFGAPVWDLLKRIGGAIWEQIQRIGRWIWEKTQPIRDFLSRAWTWFKNWLGIGEGEEGQNGVLQWFQRKAAAAWDWVMERIRPFKTQLLIIAGVLVMLSPAGPLIAVGAAVAGILRGVQWIRQHLGSRDGVVRQQSFLRGTLLPGILNTLATASGVVRTIAGRISGIIARIGGIVDQISAAVSSISILSFASGLVEMIAGGIKGLLAWADEGLGTLATWIQSGLERLGGFAQRLVAALEEFSRVTRDYFRIAGGVFRRIWNAIPACVRDPFIDYFVPLILRHVPFFSELASTPEAWQQTRAEVTLLVKQVFQNFDLLGAIKTIFRLIVRMLRIPIELVGQLLEKASQAWDLVIARPLRFIENALKAGLKGVGRFMKNILSHLWFGVQGWLLNAVSESGVSITFPSGLTDWRGWLNLVLDVLGLSVDHVIDLIDRRFPGSGRRLRQAVSFLSGALEWLRIALTEGPKGIWNHLVENLRNLGNIVIESAVGWVMGRIIAIVSARLTALAASAGLSAVLEAVVAVYQAIKTAIEYARRILQMLITVFDTVIQIANGVLDPAAEKLESAFRQAMPVVIGFLANYAGLGGIGGRVREIILEVRERVDNAILGLIDRARAAIQNVLNMIRSGVQAVAGWLGLHKNFRTPDGGRHELYFRGSAAAAQLVVASAEQTLDTLLAAGGSFENQITTSGDATKIKALGVARAQHQLVKTAQATLQTKPDDANATRQLNGAFNTLGDQLGIMGVSVVSDADLPDTIITPAANGNKAGTVTASPLSKKGKGGSGPDPNIVGWSHVLTIDSGNWERVHLVSQDFHGPGRFWNLVPARRTDNAWMREGPERSIKTMRDRNMVLHYRVQVNGYHSLTHPVTGQPIDGFPESASITLSTMKKQGSGWVIDTSLSPFPRKSFAPPSLIGGNGIDLNTANDKALRSLDIPRGVAGNVGKVKGPGHFDGKDDFIERMTAYYQGLTPPHNVDFETTYWHLFAALIRDKKGFF